MRRLALGLAVLAFAPGARGDGPLGPNGAPIRTSDYAVDLAGGPVLAGSRALGLAGAYVAIAEGVDGNLHNPAAPAVRAAWSRTHVDFDASLGVLFPSSLGSSDFFNTGRGPTDLRRSDPDELALLAPAGNLQVGPWGVGVGFELFRFGLTRRPNPALGREEELVRAQFSTVRTFLARAVDDGQMVGGLGLHVTALDVTTRDEIFTREGNVFTTRGVSLEGGLLWRPTAERFRLGIAVRAPVTTDVDSRGSAVGGDIVLGDSTSPDALWMPRRVKRPWNADLGVAVQLGPRPLNVPWLDPVAVMRRLDDHLARRAQARAKRLARAERLGPDAAEAARAELEREADIDARYRAAQRERLAELLRRRYASLPRPYVLLSAALHADGAVVSSVGVESFLQGYVDRSGERVTLTPRLGVETEAVPGWLKLRGGTYDEPSRFRGGRRRTHGTLGLDARLFAWSLFGLLEEEDALALSAAVDGARQYLGWAVSVGIWR